MIVRRGGARPPRRRRAAWLVVAATAATSSASSSSSAPPGSPTANEALLTLLQTLKPMFRKDGVLWQSSENEEEEEAKDLAPRSAEEARKQRDDFPWVRAAEDLNEARRVMVIVSHAWLPGHEGHDVPVAVGR